MLQHSIYHHTATAQHRCVQFFVQIVCLEIKNDWLQIIAMAQSYNNQQSRLSQNILANWVIAQG